MPRGPLGFARGAVTVAVLVVGGLLFQPAARPDRASAAGDPTPRSSFVVQVNRSRLTVRLQRIPLQMALTVIARKSGLALALEEPLAERVTVAFDDLPLDEGLRRLLGPRSYILSYAEAGPSEPVGVTKLVVLAKGRERLRAGEAPAVRFVVPTPQAMPAELDAARRREAVEALAASEEPGRHLNILLAVLKQDEDSDVREAALDALESLETFPLEPLAEVAMRDPQPSVRMRALELLGERGKNDRGVEAVLQRASTADPDDEVREAASSFLDSFDNEDR